MGNKLDVWKIAAGAFLIPWRNRRQFMLALANPILLIAALSLSWSFAIKYLAIPTWLSWGLYLLYLVLFIMLAVTCHRLVLLNLSEIHTFTALRWTRRENRFLFWLIFGGLVALSVQLITGTIVSKIVENIGTIMTNFFYPKEIPIFVFEYVINLAAKMSADYLLARVCVLLPAIAVDKKVNLKWAWKLTENNSWRLVLIVSVLPWILSHFIGLIYRDNATMIETILLTVLSFAFMVFEIVAISLSYYELTKNQAS
jgi:hypothetical protein